MATKFFAGTDIAALPGLRSLWERTLGDPNICVAVLDGPVDQSHVCFQGANLVRLPSLVSKVPDQEFASQHGTHVTSVIFGQPGSPIHGIAPGCRGLIIPVFADGSGGTLAPCSQIDLARAITQAVEHGANVINISGGQLSPSGEPDPLLANAVRLCQDNNVLIVAAAGNDGCDCLHVPAALASVLAVGAIDSQGRPIAFSNWGKAYQTQGIVAIGENIVGALPGGGTLARSGTSFATPVVAGVVALLLSLQIQQGKDPDPQAIRQAILKTAAPCSSEPGANSRRCLVGRLNVSGVCALISQDFDKGEPKDVSDQVFAAEAVQTSEVNPGEANPGTQDNLASTPTSSPPSPQVANPFTLDTLDVFHDQPGAGGYAARPAAMTMSTASRMEPPTMATPSSRSAAFVTPSGAGGECSCGGGGATQLVYALGELDIDYGTEARRDSIQQLMNLPFPPTVNDLLNFMDGADRWTPVQDTEESDAAYRERLELAKNPWVASQVIWILKLDATPIYAITPTGPFASMTYARLRSFLKDQLNVGNIETGEFPTSRVERAAIPGYLSGSVRLASGQMVPAIVPEIRGMFNWSTRAILDMVTQNVSAGLERANIRNKLEEYLLRIYYEYRNLGITPQERALNFSATNTFQSLQVMTLATTSNLGLDTISVEKSPVCRPDSDCYDVKLKFFNLENSQSAGRVFRFTIDVSDVIPVTLGEIRSWPVSI